MADRERHLAIWQRVRAHLEGELDLSIAQVSKDTGIPYPTVNRWWAERYLPDPTGLQALIVAYDLNGHWVMTGQGSPDAMVAKGVERADVVGSMGYQMGGAAAIALVEKAVVKALAQAKQDWATPPTPELDRVRGAAEKVAKHLKKTDKKGRAAG